MSQMLEVRAVRAIIAWPFLARMLSPEDFGMSHLRAAFEHVANGGKAFDMQPGTAPYRALVEYDLWDTDDARVSDVHAMREEAAWNRRRVALIQALDAIEKRDTSEYKTAIRVLQTL